MEKNKKAMKKDAGKTLCRKCCSESKTVDK